ncbi:pyruvoyl-dependent arginine decarboxylase [Halalkalicoccus jeotgali]|uniref:arginine decarboxylase n=1 Tax=Halalkalicoccus jeotgali (strain DSM 18796 / CECT 7217 / JCM 14584 / KCTC 4019 / B3) TaxID=795797 RepID=D8J8W9_HALJB|nr:pyruvoyl-dependent arginine decarboxylase [Halalkalicoccus jeotgali]ADJ14304.1 pyruvoyl-dependent arginine decarboxylase [Halalkalicoccus jeotgali B3]ELY40567.1 pyruvoyl-dependent arginine decarboxylase [Halalkalicoccus jeotgali B3]
MEIRIVRGSAIAPTEMASYDAALAEANVHNYNLTHVSSVIPADASVEFVGRAPDLGPVGDELTVVEARATSATRPVSAALAWTRSDGGPGLFYEAAGEETPERVRSRVKRGIAAGMDLREWSFGDVETAVSCADPDDGFATAVVLAVYGSGRAIR